MCDVGYLVVCFFGYFMGIMVTYIWLSLSILVLRYCGGGCRKLVRCKSLLWDNRFYSQCSLLVVRVAM